MTINLQLQAEAPHLITPDFYLFQFKLINDPQYTTVRSQVVKEFSMGRK